MKTSNKILTGLFTIVLLLGISFMFLLKANLIPYDANVHLKNLTSKMGDIRGIKSDGDFKIRVVQYDGDSEIQIKSKVSIVDYFDFKKLDDDILYLGIRDLTSGSERADVVVKMKECKTFKLTESTDLQFANPLININDIHVELEDNATADISLEGDLVRLKISNNSSIRLTGKVKNIILEAKDNGRIDASALEADEAIVWVTDNADVNLKVKDKISGTVKDNAALEYKGTPVSEVVRENE